MKSWKTVIKNENYRGNFFKSYFVLSHYIHFWPNFDFHFILKLKFFAFENVKAIIFKNMDQNATGRRYYPHNFYFIVYLFK